MEFKMKFIRLMFTYSLLFTCIVSTAPQTPTIFFGALRYKNTNGTYSYISGGSQIGRYNGTNGINPSSDEDLYRAVFDVGSIYPLPPTPGATLIGVKLFVKVHGSIGYSAKIVRLPDGALNASAYQTNWDNVGNSTIVYYSNIPYKGDENFYELPQNSSLNSACVANYATLTSVNIGIMSNDEATDLTRANVDIRWEPIWNIPYYTLYFENSFGAGTLLVDNLSVGHGGYRSLQDVSQHPITAVDQTYNSIDRIWNTTGAPSSKSEWWKRPSQGTAARMSIFTQTYNYTVASADNNATIIAGMMNRYKISRYDQSDGGTSNEGIQAQIVEQNSGSITAPTTKSIGSDVYNFVGWIDGDINTTKIIPPPTNNLIFTAVYKGKLRTGRPDLTNTYNQRRLITTGSTGNWIMVYESMGNVYLSYSGDGGVNWYNNEVRLNSQQGTASNPTISNVLYYNGYRPCYLIAWVETVGGISTLHFQSLQFYGGYYWGWKYYPDNGQDGTNHKTLNQIPMGQGGITTSWPLRSDARPIVYLTQNGSAIKTYFAYEGTDDHLKTGFMTTPVIDNDLSGTYLDRIGLDPYVRTASSYSAYYPVIITYPSSYGYPAKTFVCFLSSGYASGRRVAAYDFDSKTESVLSNPNNDYTYFSLQGAVSPANGTYALVSEGVQSYSGYHTVNLYYHPTYYGSTIPGPSVVATNMSQPAHMLDQISGFGTSWSGAIVMKSASDNNFYQYTGSLAQVNTNANVAGVFTREQTTYPDRTSMIVKTTTSPATLTKYSGSGLAKIDGSTIAINKHLVRIVEDGSGKKQRIALDISNASVEAIDSLETGDNVCVVKATGWNTSAITQIDSLKAPLSVTVKRNGKTIRFFNASLWKTLTAANLPDVQDGDLIIFSLKGMKKIASFTLIGVGANKLQKGNGNNEVLIPTEQNISLFPNPFNPTTTFRISLPEAKYVRLAVYNMLGQKIATVVDGDVQAGFHDFRFDGSSLASGIYLYRLEAGKEIKSGKLMLVK